MSSPINTSLSLGQALAGAEIREPSRLRQFIGGNFVSPSELAEMREWLEDCAVSICASEEECADNLARVAAWTSEQVVRAVAKTYSGGIPAFLQSCANDGGNANQSDDGHDVPANY